MLTQEPERQGEVGTGHQRGIRAEDEESRVTRCRHARQTALHEAGSFGEARIVASGSYEDRGRHDALRRRPKSACEIVQSRGDRNRFVTLGAHRMHIPARVQDAEELRPRAHRGAQLGRALEALAHFLRSEATQVD